MSAFACLPQKLKATWIHRFRWETFSFCRVCNAVQQHNSNTHIYIMTFAIFNMVPVYPGLGSSYGLRVIHIREHCLWNWACHWRHRQTLRQTTRWVRGQFIAWRERTAITQTLQLKRPIWSVINVTLSVHKDEYKTVSLRTISLSVNAPCDLIRLRIFPYANQRFVSVRRMLCLIGATDVFLLQFNQSTSTCWRLLLIHIGDAQRNKNIREK